MAVFAGCQAQELPVSAASSGTDTRSNTGANPQHEADAAASPGKSPDTANAASGADATGSAASASSSSSSSGVNTDPAAGAIAQERRSITFRGSKGDQIQGYLWLPARQEGQKFPATLMMYGITGDKDDSGIAAAAVILSDDAIVSMTLDWPGTGSRLPKISSEERVTNTSVLQWTVDDYRAALDFLSAQPEVDGSRLAYVGASMGAMTGLAFAATEPRIKAMSAVVPIPDPLWGGADPEVTIKSLAPRPVQCIATQSNVDFSQVVCGNVGANGQMKTFDAGHELQNIRPEVGQAIKGFLDQHLK